MEKWAGKVDGKKLSGGKKQTGKELKGAGYPTAAGKSWWEREIFPGGICLLAGKGNGPVPMSMTHLLTGSPRIISSENYLILDHFWQKTNFWEKLNILSNKLNIFGKKPLFH